MAYRILVSSYTDEVYALHFETESLSLTQISSVLAGYHPSWITPHPSDPSLIFASLEQTDGILLAIKYDRNLMGKVVGKVSSGGADPCSLLVMKDELLVANYSSGTLATIPVSPEPPFFLSNPTTTIQLEGSGPNRERQQSSHAHQVCIHETNNELLVPDLGSDKVWRLRKGKCGSWTILGHVPYKPGEGPRHVAIVGQLLYTVLELSNAVSKHNFPPLPKEPSFVASAPTLSHAPLSPHTMLASEILIPVVNAKYPKTFVYVSNRNDPSPDGDIIAIYTESLEMVAEVRTGLKHIRGMAFGGPHDKWLIAGGVHGGGVAIFERIDGGKNLAKVASNPDVKAPTGFLWI